MLNKKNKIIFGYLGILGVIVTIISDLILMSRPSTGKDFIFFGIENIAYVSHWRIIAGVFIGLVALPFQTLGIVLVYDGLNKSKRIIKLVVSGLFAHGLALGIAFHTTYAFLAGGYEVYLSSEATKINQIMINKFVLYWRILLIIIFIEMLIASILFAIEILKGNSEFSKILVVFNPALLSVVIFLIVYILPNPIGGIIGPTSANFITLVFFIFIIASRKKYK